MIRETVTEERAIVLGETTIVPIVRTRILTVGGNVLATKSCIALLRRDASGEERLDLA